LNDSEWARGMTRLWIGSSEDDPDVVATWGLFDLDTASLDAMRDDPAWMAAENRRMERMAPHEAELITSSYLRVAERSCLRPRVSAPELDERGAAGQAVTRPPLGLSTAPTK
jgi:hypothetical protein